MSSINPVSSDEGNAALMRSSDQGVMGLALMEDGEFEQRLQAMKKGQERIRRVKRDLMEQDAHYGVIPHTDKPTLLKPGSEVLLNLYGLRPDFLPTVEYGDGVVAPPVRVTIRCELHQGNLSGPVVGVGYGAANSWERKHRYRRAERTCPECGVMGSVIRGKAEYGGGWLCWAKKGGCGTKFAEDDTRVTEQAVADVENPDQHDLENTLLKMAEKRAQIDATLRATASSDLFTQDVEDLGDTEPAKPAPKAPAKPSQREPGSDDAENIDPAAAYAKHGVEPPAKPAPKSNGRGTKIACPGCGGPAYATKPEWSKPGKTHYCTQCGLKFEPEAVRS